MELSLIYFYFTDCLILYFVCQLFCVFLPTRTNFVTGLCAVLSLHVNKQESNWIELLLLFFKIYKTHFLFSFLRDLFLFLYSCSVCIWLLGCSVCTYIRIEVNCEIFIVNKTDNNFLTSIISLMCLIGTYSVLLDSVLFCSYACPVSTRAMQKNILYSYVFFLCLFIVSLISYLIVGIKLCCWDTGIARCM
jgi:hypothetical protein